MENLNESNTSLEKRKYRKRRQISQNEKDLILEDQKFLSITEICRKYDRNETTIRRILKPLIKSGERKVKKFVLWTEQEDNFLKSNHASMTYKQMSEALSIRTVGAIERRMNILGLTKDKELTKQKRSKALKKYLVNEHVFDEPNIVNCYWAGILSADSTINDKSSKRVVLKFKRDDEHHLREFSKFLEVDLPIYRGSCTNKKTGKTYYSSSVAFSSERIKEKLKEHFNITPRKSLTLQPPNIADEKLVAAFIKGFLDGDASLGFICNFNKEFKRVYNEISFVGTYEVLSWIKHYFDLWAPTEHSWTELSNVNKINENSYSYAISSFRAHKVCQKLLSVDVPGLERKWSKVIEHGAVNIPYVINQ